MELQSETCKILAMDRRVLIFSLFTVHEINKIEVKIHATPV